MFLFRDTLENNMKLPSDIDDAVVDSIMCEAASFDELMDKKLVLCIRCH